MASDTPRPSAVLAAAISAAPPPTLSPTTAELAAILTHILETEQAVTEAVVASPDRTFAESFAVLADYDGWAASLSGCVTLPSMVAGAAEVRSASSDAKKRLKDMWNARALREDLFAALSAASAECAKSDDLCPIDQRLVETMLRDFERNGLGQDAAVRAAVGGNQARLSELCAAFEMNINEDTSKVWFRAEDLEGLPSAVLASLPTKESDDDPGVTLHGVSLKRPVIVPVMKHVGVAETRARVAAAKAFQCAESNGPLLTEMAAVRNATARLLGRSSHADFVLEPRMAETLPNVVAFAFDLAAKLRDQCASDLSALAASLGVDSAAEVNAWDLSFATERLKKEAYSLDDEEVRQYFPVDSVVTGTLAAYERVLGVSFVPIPDASDTWHPDVTKYEVRQATSGRGGDNDGDGDRDLVGSFFLDLYPREGKYAHQCVFPVTASYTETGSGTYHVPTAAIIGNMSKPTLVSGGAGDDGAGEVWQPGLLRFSEVVTFFHEFGHICHAVLTDSPYARFAWAWSAVPWPGGVEMDFLEAPSQLFENFVYEDEVLALLSRHVETGEPLPAHLAEKLIALRHLNEGIRIQRQLVYTIFDLVIHSQDPPYNLRALPGVPDAFFEEADNGDGDDTALIDRVALWEALYRRFRLPALPAGADPGASFYHMCQGYDAGYYGYIWSEVYSHDLYSRFTEGSGCFDPAAGEGIRTSILAPGATQSGTAMLREFLGREPSNKPFLKSLGVGGGGD